MNPLLSLVQSPFASNMVCKRIDVISGGGFLFAYRKLVSALRYDQILRKMCTVIYMPYETLLSRSNVGVHSSIAIIRATGYGRPHATAASMI